jgi:glycerophosphoryl diester phosphodiesterase
MKALNKLKKYLLDSTLLLSWRRVIQLWQPMFAWLLIVSIFIGIILTPISSTLLSMQIFRGGQLVVSNMELISWLQSPSGIGYILLALILIMMGIIIRYAGIFQIISDVREGYKTSVFHTFLILLGRIPTLAKLCLFAVSAMLFLLVFLIVGIYVIYLLFLGEHDINYYLSAQPAEWYHTIIVTIGWCLIWFAAAFYLVIRSIMTIPAYLHGYKSLRKAFLRSWYLAKDRSARFFRLIIISAGIWLLATLILDAALYLVASLLIRLVAALSISLRLIVLTSGFYLLVSVIVGTIVSFLGFSFVSTLITKYYYDDTDLHSAAPIAPKIREMRMQTVEKLSPLIKLRYLIPISAILLIGSIILSGIMLDRIPELQDVKIAAHRGGPPPAPENTLAALELAIEQGADYSEIDVQFTRDKRIVVVHDVDLMRVARDPRRISQVRYRDIAHLVQIPNDGTDPAERKIATLQDFIERAEDRIKLMIELKYYNSEPDLADEVVRLVNESNLEEEIMIMSLRMNPLQRVRELNDRIKTGFVSAITLGDMKQLPVDVLIINHRNISPTTIRRARANNMEVYGWTVNSADSIAEMIELGVDGIITDYPGLASRVRDELFEMSKAERLLLRFRKLLLTEDESIASF